MKKSIKTRHREIQLAAFMPDATYRSIKSISFKDVKDVRTKICEEFSLI